jgi:hypothetical protein
MIKKSWTVELLAAQHQDHLMTGQRQLGQVSYTGVHPHHRAQGHPATAGTGSHGDNGLY